MLPRCMMHAAAGAIRVQPCKAQLGSTAPPRPSTRVQEAADARTKELLRLAQGKEHNEATKVANQTLLAFKLKEMERNKQQELAIEAYSAQKAAQLVRRAWGWGVGGGKVRRGARLPLWSAAVLARRGQAGAVVECS